MRSVYCLGRLGTALSFRSATMPSYFGEPGRTRTCTTEPWALPLGLRYLGKRASLQTLLQAIRCLRKPYSIVSYSDRTFVPAVRFQRALAFELQAHYFTSSYTNLNHAPDIKTLAAIFSLPLNILKSEYLLLYAPVKL